jgi:phenylacetate-CoA ligase
VERPGTIAKALGLRAWRSPADLLAYQERRLRKLVAYAGTQVPYYRELFARHGIAPAGIRTRADLARVPISSKAELRDQPAQNVLGAGYRADRLRRIQTTGSSGEPFVLFRTAIERRLQHLFWLRAQRQLGQRLGNRVVWISAKRSRPASRLDRIGDLLRVAGLDSYGLDVSAPIDVLLRELAKLGPAVVVAYPGMLARLGEELQRNGRDKIRPRFVLTGGEGLTKARRSQIEVTWGAPAFEVYACWEVNLMAWQCRTTGLFHVCDDSVIVEVVRDGRPVAAGERGEVVVTSLHSFAMPLIRYRLGDLVTRAGDACACGQPFSTIGSIQGRMLDFFRLPGGRLLHPYEILSDLKEDAFRWVRQYQLVQEAEDLGSEAQLRTEVVDRIEPELGGKFRLARSLVTRAADEAAWHRAEPGG